MLFSSPSHEVITDAEKPQYFQNMDSVPIGIAGNSGVFVASGLPPIGNAQIVQSSDIVSAAGAIETSQSLLIAGATDGNRSQPIPVTDGSPLPAPLSKETLNTFSSQAPAELPISAAPNNALGGLGLQMPQSLLSRSLSADRNLQSTEQTNETPMPVDVPEGKLNDSESKAPTASPAVATPNRVSGAGSVETTQSLESVSPSETNTLQSSDASSVPPIPIKFSEDPVTQYSQAASTTPPVAAPSEEVLIELEVPKGEDIPLVFADVLADDDFTPAELAKNQSLADDFALKVATSGAAVNPVRWRREVNHADELFYTWYGQDAYYAMQARRQNEKTSQP